MGRTRHTYHIIVKDTTRANALRIAREQRNKYHVRARDIRKWNSIRGSTIRIGQRLTIYPRGSNKLANKG